MPTADSLALLFVFNFDLQKAVIELTIAGQECVYGIVIQVNVCVVMQGNAIVFSDYAAVVNTVPGQKFGEHSCCRSSWSLAFGGRG